MPKWIRISLKVLLIIIGVLLLLWLGLAWYVSRNKDKLIKSITAQLNERISGDLKVSNMDIAMFRSFPNISISLQNVSLQDSLWQQHKHDLIKAEYVFAELNLKSVIKGNADIGRLVMQNGSIYLFTDSTGYSNTNVFRKKPGAKKKKSASPDFDNVTLENVQFTIENEPKNKLFEFNIKSLSGEWDHYIGGWGADIDLNVFIKNFCFNSERGSFMKEKDLIGTIRIKYDDKTNTLSLDKQPVKVGVTPIKLTGTFNFATKPAEYNLEIASDKMQYKNAVALMTPPISSKLVMVDLKKPAAVRALIIGKMKYRDTPWVRVYFDIKDNTLVTPVGDISNTSFTGVYDNQLEHVYNHKDDNSYIRVDNMKGTIYEIPFTVDSLNVENLIRPVLSGRFRSKVDLRKVNNLISGNTFQLNSGTGVMDVIYKGGINEDDTTTPYIKGYIQVSNANIAYTPRGLNFTDCSATVQFLGSDLFFKNVKVKSGASSLSMEGSILKFLDLYYKSPDKAIIDWHINSPYISLNDFRSFLGSRQVNASAGKVQVGRVNRFITRLNTFLDASNAHLKVNVNKLDYKRFTASAIKADVILKRQDISVENISLNHAGGQLLIKGEVATNNASNPFKLTADIAHVDVAALFYGFDNFGQDAIIDKNLHGQLSASADVTGTIKSSGELVPRSLNGACIFHLTNGAIVNFEPFENIGKFVFRKRNLSNITFKKLENKLLIKGDKIVIEPMQIESSALNVFLEGTYSLAATGTDINMEIPLRNPKKDELILDEELKEEKARKGIVLYLKALNGDDGKVKIKWNKEGRRIEPKYK